MSCWVVPTIAAELWGIPVNQVMDQVAAGALNTQTAHGWLMVDVAPHSHHLHYAPGAGAQLLPPPTYTILSSEEAAALAGDELDAAPEPALAICEQNRDAPEPERAIPAAEPLNDADHSGAANESPARDDDDCPGGDDESTATFSWRNVRATRGRVGLTRKPPSAH